MHPPFVLTPAEKALVGLKFDGERLQIGLSLSRRVWMGAVTLFHGAFAAVYVRVRLGDEGSWWGGHDVRNRNALVALGLVYGLWWLAICWQILRQRITATSEAVEVRQPFGRNKRFEWSRVADIRLVQPRDSAVSTRQPTFFDRDEKNLGVPVLILAEGPTVWLRGFGPPFVGFRRPWSRSVDEVDQRMRVLRRFRDALPHPWPSETARTVDRERLLARVSEELWGLPGLLVIVAFTYLSR